MPTGPKGAKRPADPIANAVHVMRVATGGIEETHVSGEQREGGRDRIWRTICHTL